MITTKICRGCNKEFPLTEFYKHKQMGDGHLNFCKGCVKTRVAKHRESHIEKIREYDRKRTGNPKRIKLRFETTKRRRKETGYGKAHLAVNRALRKGIIKKPDTCFYCSSKGRIEAHHQDYSKPLEVTWLCPACHRMLHMGKSDQAKEIQSMIAVPL